MNIQSINSITSAAVNQRGTENKGKLGQQEFLQLLVAQMRHQDPINPLDGAEFASQLAQFNSVEQLISVNGGIRELQQSQEMMSASLTNSMAASLTGKQVKALSNQVYLNPVEPADIKFELNNSANEVEIIVRSASGAEVRREVIQGAPSGENQWQWDGRNNMGDRMGEGQYSIEINASNEDGKVNSLMFIEGVATKVRYTGNGVYISVNNVLVPIGDVEEIGINLF
jgi:flagellar basal-body rod modification protein FlgD